MKQSDRLEYHLNELRIAQTPSDPRRILPPIDIAHQRILDVGCGAGQTLIASTLCPGVLAIGVDVSLDALLLGRELTMTIHFVCARGEALPVPSDYFDLVISRVAIPYMRIRPALAEICRVVKVNGSIWLTLHSFSKVAGMLVRDLSHLDIPRAAYRLYVMANGLTSQVLNKEFACPFTGGRVETFQTRRRITHCLSELGCVDIKIAQDRFVVTATKGAGTLPAR